MKTHLKLACAFVIVTLAITGFCPLSVSAQTVEWRLVQKSYVADNPDVAGPALGTATFDLEMRAASGTVQAREIAVGYSYQSTKAMVPSANGICPPTGTPTNINVSPQFAAGGYTYTSVNQCNVVVTTVGGQVFDRTASGTFEQGGGAGITLTTDWVPALNITLWTLSPVDEVGGFVMLNSGSSGSPGALGTYSMANAAGDEVTVNSLSFSTPVALNSTVLPVTLSVFDITCSGNGTLLRWQTLTEQNTKNFEVQKSPNGINGWTTLKTSAAFGTSNTQKSYDFTDVNGGPGYYRLKQNDNDGRFTYSAIQRSQCRNKTSSLLVYPIPAKNVLNIMLSSERRMKASLQLFDVSGKLLKQQPIELNTGSNNFRLNVAGIATGEYILKVAGLDYTQVQMLTIER